MERSSNIHPPQEKKRDQIHKKKAPQGCKEKRRKVQDRERNRGDRR